ncbi:hypothetical protein ACFLY0_00350 [Patescibacteria group bacterium]
MDKADISIEIIFDINHPEKTLIKTNAKKEALEEILEAWLYCQTGQGADESEPDERDVYNIQIQLDLSDDSFATSSDTGNKGLTVGLVIDVFRRLSEVEVRALSVDGSVEP